MPNYQDDEKKLVRRLSDKSRKVVKVGKKFLVPHKTTPTGEIVRGKIEFEDGTSLESNFDANRDISKLNLSDLRFLELWRDNKWNDEETLKKTDLTQDQAVKTFKKLQYFKTEDSRIRALASQASPEMVLSKDIENLHTHTLQDTDHKSLDRISKITGAFKTTEGNSTINIFNMPRLSPEAEAALKKIAEREADIVEAHVVGE